jgi:Ca-activated chloride channel family protein
MALGTICIISDTGRTQLSPEAVTIDGIQHGFVVSMKITQRFKNTESAPVDLSYLIPNNSKICLYDTTFRLRDEVIKPRLERKAAAEEIYDEARSEGRAAILSRSLGNGLVEFQLGNLPPDSFCEVEVDCGFVASSSGADKLFFKFPLWCAFNRTINTR